MSRHCPAREGSFVVFRKRTTKITKTLKKIIMKTKFIALWSTILLATAVCAMADDELPKAKPGSPEFEKLKTLVGSWQGKTDMGHGPMDISIQYRLLAGGNVLEERVFAGTPHEMVTMYYDKDGKLAMTHYCVFGNRPGMLLKSSTDKSLKFDFDETCGIDAAKESHMHA